MTRCSFAIAHYEEVVARARTTHDIVLFREWRPAAGRPRLFLRHDIDHSLRLAFDLAQREQALGVRATYFVQLHSALYTASTAAAAEVLRQIVALGHEVGLHYDTGYYAKLGLDGPTALRADLDQLGVLTGVDVQSISRHSPVDSPTMRRGESPVRWDAYSDPFIRDVKYLSDSNRAWREGCFCEHLAHGEELHVLTHPVWWLAEGDTMRDQVIGTAALEAGMLTTAAEHSVAFYEDCLMRRQELDARIKVTGF